ncbi:hypothetical protein HW555_008237 [Spodoptera exigua]|uniref:Uncharacterized protein n=1 Tax=Spodoptera exigua TaxID=7107 RepID=A0A835GEN0_SPOEX|nr:hypothetical protein HW555_008237 [Spodoptera exigua]
MQRSWLRTLVNLAPSDSPDTLVICNVVVRTCDGTRARFVVESKGGDRMQNSDVMVQEVDIAKDCYVVSVTFDHKIAILDTVTTFTFNNEVRHCFIAGRCKVAPLTDEATIQ